MAVLITAVLMIFAEIALAANLDLAINGAVNDYSSDLVLRTDSRSNNGFDKYDMVAPSSPSNASSFYSSITGYSLSIDSWNANDNPRTLSLVYSMDEAQTGTLTFSWAGITSGYTATLRDYGTDSSYSVQLGGDVDMSDQSSYPKTLSSDSNIYLKIVIDTAATDSTSTTGTGGGGAGAASTKASMKIKVPKPITIDEIGIVEIPITLENNGDYNLYDISLSTEVLKDALPSEIEATLDKTFFDSLATKQKKNLLLRVIIDEDDVSLYEVQIEAKSRTPSFTTQGKVYIDFSAKNASGIKKMVVFAEDMIVENPECLELKEMVDEAKKALEEGKEREAIAKAEAAVEACRQSISGPKKAVFPSFKDLNIEKNIIFYLAIGVVAAIIFGIMFNLYKMRKFKKKT